MPPLFEFVIEQPPVSAQARRSSRRREWRRDLGNVIEGHWNSDPISGRTLMVVITYFFEQTPMDVDNIPKPILDELKGVVFSDDSEVYDLLCRKRDRTGRLNIVGPSRALTTALANARQVLHVSVFDVQSQEVTF